MFCSGSRASSRAAAGSRSILSISSIRITGFELGGKEEGGGGRSSAPARDAEGVEELAGARGDVGAAMALDLGGVGQATHTEAIELAPQHLRQGTRNGGLADTRGARQAEDLALGG